MQTSTAMIVITVAFILGIEGMLWSLFKKKIAGLMFPHESDASSLSFFTLGRLRWCAVVHSLFLIACTVGAILLFS